MQNATGQRRPQGAAGRQQPPQLTPEEEIRLLDAIQQRRRDQLNLSVKLRSIPPQGSDDESSLPKHLRKAAFAIVIALSGLGLAPQQAAASTWWASPAEGSEGEKRISISIDRSGGGKHIILSDPRDIYGLAPLSKGQYRTWTIYRPDGKRHGVVYEAGLGEFYASYASLPAGDWTQIHKYESSTGALGRSAKPGFISPHRALRSGGTRLQIIHPSGKNDYGGFIVLEDRGDGDFVFVGWRTRDFTSSKNGVDLADVAPGSHRRWHKNGNSSAYIYQLPDGRFVETKPGPDSTEVNADPPAVAPPVASTKPTARERELLAERRAQAEAELVASHSRPPRGSSGDGRGGSAQPNSPNVSRGDFASNASLMRDDDDGGHSKRIAAEAAQPAAVKEVASNWAKATAEEQAAAAPAIAAAIKSAEQSKATPEQTAVVINAIIKAEMAK